MPAKQAISVKSPTKHQELTPIENQLLECAKSGKPVLLYGEDITIDRKNLIYEIHKRAIGMDEKKELTIPENIKKGSFDSIIKDSIKRYYIDCDCKIIDNREIGGKAESIFSNSVFIAKVFDECQIFDEWAKGFLPELDLDNLIKLFFLDNLYSKPNTDCEACNKLTQIIGARILNKWFTRGNWLVVFTHDLKSLPEYFNDRFEKVCLEAKKQDTSASTPNGNLFHREGDYWTIRYKDKLIRLKHCKGLDCIAYLLENENKDLSAYEVVQAIDKDQFQKDCTKIKGKKGEDGFFDESSAYDEGLTFIKVSGLNEKYRKRISASMGRSLNRVH